MSKEADLGQAVQDDPLRICAFERFKDGFCCFTQLEIGRIKQTLLLVGIEQAFGWNEFKNRDHAVELPSMRRGTGSQLPFRLRQCDIEALLADRCAFQQESERDCRLSRAGLPFEQKDVPWCQATAQDIVKSRNAGSSLIPLHAVNPRHRFRLAAPGREIFSWRCRNPNMRYRLCARKRAAVSPERELSWNWRAPESGWGISIRPEI